MGSWVTANALPDDAVSVRDVAAGDLAATEQLAGVLAAVARPGDVFLLCGDLGAGKTAFARGFIVARARMCGQEAGPVPSPTFTLVQRYDFDVPVLHADLYRLDSADEAAELGLDEAYGESVTLIEWPDRLAGRVPPHRLDIAIRELPEHPSARRITLTGRGRWAPRLDALCPKGGKR